jgi:hypothetical protein
MCDGRYRRFVPQSGHAATIQVFGIVSTGAGMYFRQSLQAMTKG